jgi:hypothetical protein
MGSVVTSSTPERLGGNGTNHGGSKQVRQHDLRPGVDRRCFAYVSYTSPGLVAKTRLQTLHFHIGDFSTRLGVRAGQWDVSGPADLTMKECDSVRGGPYLAARDHGTH